MKKKANQNPECRTSTIEAAPHASILIESMRDIGYTLETALADIVDNSIAAGATKISIFSDINNSDPKICILDNGEGMNKEKLYDAMRPGSRNPLEMRDSHDLGRFGLGLKTASFSQCRKITILTKNKLETSAACWDLDFVAKINKWLVVIPSNISEIPWSELARDR